MLHYIMSGDLAIDFWKYTFLLWLAAMCGAIVVCFITLCYRWVRRIIH